MKRRIPYILTILFAIICVVQTTTAKKIHNRHYKFKISVPDQMVRVDDTSNTIQGDLYYDTVAGIILMVSARESRFKSVNDYIDCRKEQLEQQLRNDYGDIALRLINCSRSPFYPRKITVLNFMVSVLPFGYNTYIIYFIHHNGNDIQVSFTYKKESERISLEYINEVMRTLKLK